MVAPLRRLLTRIVLMQSSVYIGGQAVLEGVMMRSPKSFVVAVRKPSGEIVVREQGWETLLGWFKPLRWPFVRGAIVLIESLWNGLSALNFSAEQALPEEPAGKGESKVNTASASGDKPSAANRAALAGTLAVSIGLGMALFVGVPHALTWLLGQVIGVPLDTRSVAFHAVDGIIKLTIFLAYLWGISRLKEIHRVFEYHGAEHKAIWAYETGGPLTAENAAKFTTLHPRCGTSFLIIVLGISIVVFAVVFPFVPQVSTNKLVNNLFMIAFKIPLMFPVAGLSYEFQRLSAKPDCPRFVKWLVAPGLRLQRITTQEPSREQLEISLVALGRALAHEQGKLAEAGVRVFRDFDGALAVP